MRKKLDLEYLCHMKLCYYFGRRFFGGAYLVNCQQYLRCGGENERFVGWGPEDAERMHRINSWVQGSMDSEWATVSSVSSPWQILSIGQKEDAKFMRDEFIKICCMSLDELKSYISK